MAKTKQQRAAAHQRQLERAARMRQRGNLSRRAPSKTATPLADGLSISVPALPHIQEQTSLQSFAAEEISQEMALPHPYSAEITGRRRSTHGGACTKFVISVTGSGQTSTVERSYSDFEVLLAKLQPMMPELPAMPPNTLQHACIAGRYVEMREEGLQQLLAAMLKADDVLRSPELRGFLFADLPEVQETCQEVEAADVPLPAAPLDATETKMEVLEIMSDSDATTEGQSRNTESVDSEDDEALSLSEQPGIVAPPESSEGTAESAGDKDDEVISLLEQPCILALPVFSEDSEASAILETVDVSFEDEEERASVFDGASDEKPSNDVVAEALRAYEVAFEAAVTLKLQVTRRTHDVAGNQPNMIAARFHEIGKVKFQIGDLSGALQSFAEAEAIYRQVGTLKTLAGAHLLQDLSAVKLHSGDLNGALKACKDICEYASSFQTPAAIQLLHDVGELWDQCEHADCADKIFTATQAFMEDVNKADLDVRANHSPQSKEETEVKRRGPLCMAFLKLGQSLLSICSTSRHHQ